MAGQREMKTLMTYLSWALYLMMGNSNRVKDSYSRQQEDYYLF